jgi:hypothetical protein
MGVENWEIYEWYSTKFFRNKYRITISTIQRRDTGTESFYLWTYNTKLACPFLNVFLMHIYTGWLVNKSKLEISSADKISHWRGEIISVFKKSKPNIQIHVLKQDKEIDYMYSYI